MKTEKYAAEEEVPGIQIDYFTKQLGAELICEFKLGGKKFELTEPFGDNSFYDIACETPDSSELEVIYTHFTTAKLPTRTQKNRYFIMATTVAILLAVCWYYAD